MKIVDLYDKCGVDYIDEFVFSKENPWELLPLIGGFAKGLVEKGIPGYKLLKEGVLVGENVKIADTATINGPCVLGNNVEVRPGAYIRGNVVVGDESVVGNSSELKNAVLMRHTQVPHYNYVGDSVLGSYAHMGAGSILSNLRSDNKPVIIHNEGEDVPTGIRKIGSFLADHADIGCGSVLNPGTIIGKNTQVYPLTMCRGVYPENSIVKSTRVVVAKK
ncbi:MAG: UDP-N-acetylglucosamine pyrophosphorylase [Bacilli bacterium]|nr:UDP-N-acetylglucosamine pyrophosphorylase [Bacilli bacterium]